MKAEPVHVALFSDCYRPRINGVVTSLVSLKSSLEKLGHRVTLVAPSYPCQEESEGGLIRLSAFSFPNWPEDRAALPWPPAALNSLRRANFDVIHVHTPFIMGVAGWKLARSLKRPMVFTHHTLWEEYSHYLPWVSHASGKKIADVICRYFFTRASAIVAPSEAIQEQLKLKGFQEKSWVVPTGIEPQLFVDGDAEVVFQELGISAATLIFLYIGRLAREKSIDFILRAFQRVQRDVSDARLIIVGGGPEQTVLHRLAQELGLNRSVHFLGYRPRAELKNYLAAASLFVFASETETQGLVLLEAAAAGLPALAIRATGVSEAIRDGSTGILCSSGDLEGYTRHMLSFATKKEGRADYSAQAQQWAGQFHADTCGLRMLEVYRSVCSHRIDERTLTLAGTG